MGIGINFLKPKYHDNDFFYASISFIYHFICMNWVSKQLDRDWTAFKVTKPLIWMGKSLQNVVKESVVEIISSDLGIVVITATEWSHSSIQSLLSPDSNNILHLAAISSLNVANPSIVDWDWLRYAQKMFSVKFVW